jgi:uncharacterized metal-binding protein (TIGR02443 family)
MPHSAIPLKCPQCRHEEATLAVRSQTILTVRCAQCGYTWAMELANIPEQVRTAAQIAALERLHERPDLP